MSYSELIEQVDTQTGKKKEEYRELAKLLSSACLSVAALTKLVRIAADCEDFELQKKTRMMISKSFFGSVVQVTNSGCAAFVFANEQFSEIQMTSYRIPSVVKDLLDGFGDSDLRKEVLSNLVSSVKTAENQASSVMAMFNDVINLILEVKGQLGFSYKEAHSAMQDGITQLSVVKNTWSLIVQCFKTVSASVKVCKEASDMTQHIQNLCSFQNLLIQQIAADYEEVSSDSLEQRVRELSSLIPEAKENIANFDDLERESIDDASNMEERISDGEENLEEEIASAFEELKG